jgi:Zn-dependent protease/ATP-dependent Clp protease adapter protein ClpS
MPETGQPVATSRLVSFEIFMMKSGAFRIFSVAGINVYLHWTWFIVALIVFQNPIGKYDSPVWSVLEYLSLFGIVLLHEFGHALACRQVGGRADTIMLWPLGGVAFVSPPPRPGPVLWSIVAGPLVNVLLIPVTIAPLFAFLRQDQPVSDSQQFFQHLAIINFGLLIFNMLPVYPMDGGQILQALLWFLIGRAHSLMVVSIIGMIGGGVFLLIALGTALAQILQQRYDFIFLLLIALFVVARSVMGFRQALALQRLQHGPRHRDFACPACGQAPPAGEYWRCDNCQARFDTFEHHAECPECGKRFPRTSCPACHKANPIDTWMLAVLPAEDDHEPPDTHVVLINDADHTYQYVIQMLEDVFGYSPAQGAQLARQVDSEGQVVLATTSRRRAEALRSRIHAYGPDPLLRQSKSSMRAFLEPMSVLPAD